MRIATLEPKHLKYALIAVALLYLLFPRDLIPDFVGRGLGLIDDLALIGALTYFYRRSLRLLAAKTAEGSFRTEREAHRSAAEPSALDPYQVLGIPASSSRDVIRRAYRSRMAEYHPDKVSHLGKDLQELAHRKVLEIQEAYRQLKQ